MIKKYVANPYAAEAIQWTGDNKEDLYSIVDKEHCR